MSDSPALEPVYDPQAVEQEVYQSWMDCKAFRSQPAGTPHDRTFAIVIPPPNVTGALHLGHALNNTLQDFLIRYRRMCGFNTLWQPGTDHAGIATQAVVERRIREEEGKSRHDLGRDALVQRIWEWKKQYEGRIVSQLKLMGCSCDWDRQRFTLDEGLAKAVHHQFFALFRGGLIFQGKRLVNWDTELQTAVANDEVYHETVKGSFWHIRYEVIDPKPGEPEHVVIATTRPETMLGDTAVAVCPDPAAALDKMERLLQDSLASAPGREKPAIEQRLEAVTQRRSTHLAELTKLAAMARDGRQIRLPLVGRTIPLIADEWANPLLGSGCVKITPAHDPNDYEVGQRHKLPMMNVLTPDGKIAELKEPDGSINPHSSRYAGLAFSTEGRAKVVADLKERGLLVQVEEHEHEVGHSDRSKTLVEPYLSDQWFVRTGDGPETSLAQAAMDAVTSGRIKIFPTRYAKSYLDWLGEKRDWCISRQLWWGHRIPVWHATFNSARFSGAGNSKAIEKRQQDLLRDLQSALNELGEANKRPGDFHVRPASSRAPAQCWICTRSKEADKDLSDVRSGMYRAQHVVPGQVDNTTVDKIPSIDPRYGACRKIRHLLTELNQDEDVLDTWFSSALWPFSTLDWPDQSDHLRQYYPGSVLITSRDIITNWVARMVMFGLYAMGEVPFDEVYIHPKILDGRGETMSKSKGNGVDPVDTIHTHGADALRYTMADMTTETQDIRMPVEYICPHCGKLTDQSLALQVEEQSRKSRGQRLLRKLQPADVSRVQCRQPQCERFFATRWADDRSKEELSVARETSDKFDIGRNFCNKLWNAARFCLLNLTGAPMERLAIGELDPEDRWILARLCQTIRRYHALIQHYQFSASLRELREFFWESLCDWYIELTKPRLTATGGPKTQETAKQILAFCMDQTLRLFHPTIPFITEVLWQRLNKIAPQRGLPGVADLSCDGPLVLASFPPEEGYSLLENAAILKTFGELQDATRGVRELRTSCGVSPKERVTVTVGLPEARREAFSTHAHIVKHMAGIATLLVDPDAKRPAHAASTAVHDLRIYVHDISDDKVERQRVQKALAAVEKQIVGKEAKLGNEKFLTHAKPDIVQAERDRLAELRTQRQSLSAHLHELSEQP